MTSSTELHTRTHIQIKNCIVHYTTNIPIFGRACLNTKAKGFASAAACTRRSRCAIVPHRERPLQLARCGAEAVEHHVLADAVDPLAARRHDGAQEVAALALARREAAHDLQAQSAA